MRCRRFLLISARSRSPSCHLTLETTLARVRRNIAALSAFSRDSAVRSRAPSNHLALGAIPPALCPDSEAVAALSEAQPQPQPNVPLVVFAAERVGACHLRKAVERSDRPVGVVHDAPDVRSRI